MAGKDSGIMIPGFEAFQWQELALKGIWYILWRQMEPSMDGTSCPYYFTIQNGASIFPPYTPR